MGRAAKFSVVLLAAAALLPAATPQLSGTWSLEVGQSDFGNGARPNRATADYTVRGDVVNAVQTSYGAGGAQKNEMTWYLDGVRHPSNQPAPGYSVTQWKRNTLTNESSSADGLYKQTIQVTLSPDGRTATEIVDTKTPQGSNHEKLVWHRTS